ncbi:hypothetical protein CLV92_11523 [Kineococcus xinjiangensis]|uniref:tRNA_anti-like n=1 Tax=Kineococcus xinjiangensis TaxID=512762 RepID=A0A2S6IDK2_9ACTN|nr:hypothetical protein [Kineococcus xinjiangensis]PPK92277.1 hypothetical protein CLV92_11523 [Kineococcus xinjiangensis]
MSAPTPTGSHPTAEQSRRGVPWLWILLGALLLALAVWAIAAAVNDDDDEATAPVAVSESADPVEEPDVDVSPTETAPEPSPSADTPSADAPSVDAPSVDGSAAAAGALLVGGTDVLSGEAFSADALSTDADLTAMAGQTVDAREVKVLEVVADEAFYVGPDAGRSVLVRLPEFAAGESPFKVEAGDTVNLSGTLRPVDQALLDEMGAYDPAKRLEPGQVYVQADKISGVR